MLLAMAACTPVATPPERASSRSSVAAVLQETAGLQDADLVFRRGRDVMSDLVLSRQSDSRFSHVGMLVREGGALHVIHAMPDEPGMAGGVRQELLADFLAPDVASDAAVYRLSGLQTAAQQRVIDHLRKQVGLPFDFDFALSTPQQVYCSELVLAPLEQSGRRLQPDTLDVPLMREPIVVPDALRKLPGLRLVAGE